MLKKLLVKYSFMWTTVTNEVSVFQLPPFELIQLQVIEKLLYKLANSFYQKNRIEKYYW